jgi:hypothetical protein
VAFSDGGDCGVNSLDLDLHITKTEATPEERAVGVDAQRSSLLPRHRGWRRKRRRPTANAKRVERGKDDRRFDPKRFSQASGQHDW